MVVDVDVDVAHVCSFSAEKPERSLIRHCCVRLGLQAIVSQEVEAAVARLLDFQMEALGEGGWMDGWMDGG